MYENLVGQQASISLINDIKSSRFPGAVLFSGPNGSGKLTAALETARILSCTENNPKKSFNCNCPNCLQNKALTCTNIMLLGPRDCFLEIAAAKNSFLNAYNDNAPYLTAARYFFLRSIRKLTLRFNGILWQSDSSINKIGALIQDINENLEQLDLPRPLPPQEELVKICNNLSEKAMKLEADYLYDSIPVNQIRNLEEWARIKSETGKKTIIIENADKMQSSVRNAILKILEEPPLDCVFILLTCNKNAIIQTILSRLRNYTFKERKISSQSDVIQRVFHNDLFNGSINDYLLTFLPVSPMAIKEQSDIFYQAIVAHAIPDLTQIVKDCGNFNPRIELHLFLENLIYKQKNIPDSMQKAEFSSQSMNLIRKTWENVTLYNQSPVSALEILLRELSSLNLRFHNVLV